MPAYLVRMIAGDLILIVGVLLLLSPGDPTRLLSPLHLLGWLAVVGGGALTLQAIARLVRQTMRRRLQARGSGEEPVLSSDPSRGNGSGS